MWQPIHIVCYIHCSLALLTIRVERIGSKDAKQIGRLSKIASVVCRPELISRLVTI